MRQAQEVVIPGVRVRRFDDLRAAHARNQTRVGPLHSERTIGTEKLSLQGAGRRARGSVRRSCRESDAQLQANGPKRDSHVSGACAGGACGATGSMIHRWLGPVTVPALNVRAVLSNVGTMHIETAVVRLHNQRPSFVPPVLVGPTVTIPT